MLQPPELPGQAPHYLLSDAEPPCPLVRPNRLLGKQHQQQKVRLCYDPAISACLMNRGHPCTPLLAAPPGFEVTYGLCLQESSPDYAACTRLCLLSSKGTALDGGEGKGRVTFSFWA